MTAKDYLGQAYRLDQRINSKLEQVLSLRDLTTKATATMSDMPGGGSRNVYKMQDIVAKIIDLENEINADTINFHHFSATGWTRTTAPRLLDLEFSQLNLLLLHDFWRVSTSEHILRYYRLRMYSRLG